MTVFHPFEFSYTMRKLKYLNDGLLQVNNEQS